MTPQYHRLGIDFGTTHTVAVVESPDGRVQPLLFDSSPLLSSAVYADADGSLLTGRDGERSARVDPTRYEPNPKRRIDEPAVLLGNDEYPVVRLIAAVLARVVTEAVRTVGGLPGRTLLTHPANWGSQRRDALVQAAFAAGLVAVTVVPEPVAAAAHFTGILGRPVQPGEALAVYDFGAGTFDASVVRRRPDGAWDLLASEGLDDVGGLDLDAALQEQIGRVLGPRHPAGWQRLISPVDPADRRAARAFREDVRAAKEQLSRAPSAALHVPVLDTDTHVTREQFEAAARPLLERTVGLTAAMLDRAGRPPLAGLYLVGGSSRIPVIATLLHQRLGVPPTLIDTPELLVAQGSLRAVPPGADPHTATVTPAAGLFPPWPGGPGPVPPGQGTTTMPTGGSVTGPFPPAGHPVSGGAGSPVPAAPVSGGFGTPPPAPSGMPLWSGAPARPGRGRNRNTLKIVLAVVAAVVLLGGGGAVAATTLVGDGSAADGRAKRATGGDGRTDGAAPARSGTAGDGPTSGPGNAATLAIGTAVWYAGKKITVKSAAYDPTAKSDQLQFDITVENLGTDPDDNGGRFLESQFAYGGVSIKGNAEEIEGLPGKQTVNGKLVFDVRKPITDLRTGELTLGRSEHVQPKIPLGDPSSATTLEPRKVAGPTAEMRSGVLGLTVLTCEQRADFPDRHGQAKKDYMMVVCDYDLKNYRPGVVGYLVSDSSFALKLPDGTTTAAESADNPLLDANEQQQNLTLNFVVRWPAPGTYVFRFYDPGQDGKLQPDANRPVHEVPLTLS